MKSIEVREDVKVYVWKFTNERNYKGWNIACDKACATFIIDILERMKKEKHSIRYIFKTNKPAKEIIKKIALIESKIVSVDRVIFTMKKTQECKIQFNEDVRSLEILFHSDTVPVLQKYFLNIIESFGDVGLECNDDILVFWRI